MLRVHRKPVTRKSAIGWLNACVGGIDIMKMYINIYGSAMDAVS